MTIDEARAVLRDDDAGLLNWSEAAGTLASSVNVSLGDLLACLKRKGVPAEIGATALYTRTKRPREGEGLSSVSTELLDWQGYLEKNHLI